MRRLSKERKAKHFFVGRPRVSIGPMKRRKKKEEQKEGTNERAKRLKPLKRMRKNERKRRSGGSEGAFANAWMRGAERFKKSQCTSSTATGVEKGVAVFFHLSSLFEVPVGPVVKDSRNVTLTPGAWLRALVPPCSQGRWVHGLKALHEHEPNVSKSMSSTETTSSNS